MVRFVTLSNRNSAHHKPNCPIPLFAAKGRCMSRCAGCACGDWRSAGSVAVTPEGRLPKRRHIPIAAEATPIQAPASSESPAADHEDPQLLPSNHGAVLAMVAGGSPLGQVLDCIAKFVESELRSVRCAILGMHDDGKIHVLAAPSLSPDWRQAAIRTSPRGVVDGGPSLNWLCEPLVVRHVTVADHHEGTAFTVQVCSSIPVLVDGSPAGVFVLYYDTSHATDASEMARVTGYVQLAAVALSRAKAEHQLHLGLSQDPTTGLPSGHDVRERVVAAMGRRGAANLLAVMTVELPRLAEYNTTFGYGAGDDVLRFVADALTETAPANTTIMRAGGSRFVLIVEGMFRDGDVVDLAYRVAQAACGPVVLGTQPVSLEAAVGVAVSSDAAHTPEQLLAESQAAAGQVRPATRDRVVVFDPAVARRASDRLVVELGLHRALAHDELVVHYQPVCSLTDGSVVGLEALVRWDDPEHGMRPPMEFIGVAEDSGLIRQLTRHVLDTACREAARWHALRPEAMVPVSVNVSAVELHDPSLVSDVGSAIEASGLPAGLLCLEVTETAVMTDPVAGLEVLAQLKMLGVRLAIDDFGTGYSSLTYLRRLPVDYVKIDRTFVAGMLRSREDEAIVAAVITLARTLGLRLVAEGVESVAHVAALRTLMCHFAQGFHWSPAVPPSAIDRMLAATPSG